MRRTHDFYETPSHYLDALFAYVTFPARATVYEPCKGEGAISRRQELGNTRLRTNDIDRARHANTRKDATKAETWTEWEWSITNPPFNQMESIVRNMLQHSDNTIVLARLSFLEPTTIRRKLYEDFGDPDLLIVLPRYSFRLNDKGKRATDSVTCCWLGWGPEVPKVTTVWIS